MKYLYATISILASIVSALAFARLALLKPYIGLPIVAVVTALSIFLFFRYRSKLTRKDGDNNSDNSNKGSTSNVAPKKGKQSGDKTSVSHKFANNVSHDGNRYQSTDKSDKSKDCLHYKCSHYIKYDYWRGRIWVWLDSISKNHIFIPTGNLSINRLRFLGRFPLFYQFSLHSIYALVGFRIIQ